MLRYHLLAAPIAVSDVVALAGQDAGGVPMTYRCQRSPFGGESRTVVDLLPLDVWLVVLSFLCEKDRRRFKLTCVSFYEHHALHIRLRRRRPPPPQNQVYGCFYHMFSTADRSCNTDERGIRYHSCVCTALYAFRVSPSVPYEGFIEGGVTLQYQPPCCGSCGDRICAGTLRNAEGIS